MSVASLPLCTRLYEGSGWLGTTWSHFQFHDGSHTVEAKPISGYLSARGVPAYDLGFLLRKLPPSTAIRKRSAAGAAKDYSAFVPVRNGVLVLDRTPENAAVKLAIELIKHDVL